MKIWFNALFVVLFFAIFLQSCTPLRPDTFGPGDIIGVKNGMSITLEKAQVSASKLIADFSIDNSHGTKDQDISAAANFSAKDADGNTLELTICDNSSIDGKVLAGDQRKGQVCWNVITEGVKLKIYFLSADSSHVIWDVK